MMTAARRALVLAALTGLTLLFSAWADPQEGGVRPLQTDSRAPYVHRLTLYDEDGVVIDPRNEQAKPYSPQRTCGKCHAVESVHSGWHFNAGRAGVENGRPGEPWMFVDANSGTVLPLSARGWPGTWKPEDIGLTAWQFAKRFGHHLPGGGFVAPDFKTANQTPEAARWKISGPLHIDCMMCHSADQSHDPAEWERQIKQENFKYAPTAALGLAAIRGTCDKLPDDFDPDAPNPSSPEQALPKVLYNLNKFDGDDRVFFNVTRRVPPNRCYFCHTTREVGVNAPERWQVDEDVHVRAGMTCVDCHRNGIDHAIVRGFEGETGKDIAAHNGALTCRGCHLGETAAFPGSAAFPDSAALSGGTDKPAAGSPGQPSTSPAGLSVSSGGQNAQTEFYLAGRLGAPYPLHRGIPTIHFEKLTCTACHSGPWPDDFARRMQTSLAHKLGIGSRTRATGTPPEIAAPIFARGPDDKIGPYKTVWPAFWGRLSGEKAQPLPREIVSRALPKFADQADKSARKKAGRGAEDEADAAESVRRLSDEEIAKTLAALAALKLEGEPAYVRDGFLYRRGGDGKLTSTKHAAAQPYLWPLAHDVRPAGRSLGVRGCTDCHAADAPFFHGQIQPASLAAAPASQPAQTTPPAQAAMKVMHELQGADVQLLRGWDILFARRAVVKWIGWICLSILAAALLYGFASLAGLQKTGLENNNE